MAFTAHANVLHGDGFREWLPWLRGPSYMFGDFVYTSSQSRLWGSRSSCSPHQNITTNTVAECHHDYHHVYNLHLHTHQPHFLTPSLRPLPRVSTSHPTSSCMLAPSGDLTWQRGTHAASRPRYRRPAPTLLRKPRVLCSSRRTNKGHLGEWHVFTQLRSGG